MNPKPQPQKGTRTSVTTLERTSTVGEELKQANTRVARLITRNAELHEALDHARWALGWVAGAALMSMDQHERLLKYTQSVRVAILKDKQHDERDRTD